MSLQNPPLPILLPTVLVQHAMGGGALLLLLPPQLNMPPPVLMVDHEPRTCMLRKILPCLRLTMKIAASQIPLTLALPLQQTAVTGCPTLMQTPSLLVLQEPALIPDPLTVELPLRRRMTVSLMHQLRILMSPKIRPGLLRLPLTTDPFCRLVHHFSHFWTICLVLLMMILTGVQRTAKKERRAEV